MTNAQKIIDWLAEHPNSLADEIGKGAGLPYAFAGSYLRYLTRNGTLVRTGQKTKWRYRVAEESDHPSVRSDPDLVDVILVEFGYYNTTADDTKSGRCGAFFWLPVDLLWSSQGLAQMFEITRAAYCGADASDQEGEEWNTWHLVAIHEKQDDIDHRIVLNVDWVRSSSTRTIKD